MGSAEGSVEKPSQILVFNVLFIVHSLLIHMGLRGLQNGHMGKSVVGTITRTSVP